MQNQYSGNNMPGHMHMQNQPIPGLPIQSTGQSTFVQSSQGVGMPNQYTLNGATCFSARYVPTQSYVP